MIGVYSAWHTIKKFWNRKVWKFDVLKLKRRKRENKISQQITGFFSGFWPMDGKFSACLLCARARAFVYACPCHTYSMKPIELFSFISVCWFVSNNSIICLCSLCTRAHPIFRSSVNFRRQFYLCMFSLVVCMWIRYFSLCVYACVFGMTIESTKTDQLSKVCEFFEFICVCVPLSLPFSLIARIFSPSAKFLHFHTTLLRVCPDSLFIFLVSSFILCVFCVNPNNLFHFVRFHSMTLHGTSDTTG